MAILLIALVAFVALAWFGRRAALAKSLRGLPRAALATLAAAGALVCAIRGEWVPSLVLVGVALILGRGVGPEISRGSPLRAGEVDLDEARAILGVGAGAGRAEIIEAHRRMIRRVHPDLGGSTGLAARVNAARDRVLRDVPSR
jgi:hypothetical protein